MELIVPSGVLGAFGLAAADVEATRHGQGLINSSYKITHRESKGTAWLLQKINTHVFPQPEAIAHNWKLAAETIKLRDTDYFFIEFLPTLSGGDFHRDTEGAYWRLLPFVQGTSAFERVVEPQQAWSAARAFGTFCNLLSDAPVHEFYETIKGFHDLDLRVRQLKASVTTASANRLKSAADCISDIEQFNWIRDYYISLVNHPAIPLRVMHMDAKLNNVLFRCNSNHAFCLVDFDTLMPGYIISDMGDMVRTMVCGTNEEELIGGDAAFRPEYFEALIQGYSETAGESLTAAERDSLAYSGLILIYMQAIRFLTDYLAGDIYYSVTHDRHNLTRATGQLLWLKRLAAQTDFMKQTVKRVFG
jgi:Ser/Thr protein kinase RdoA (MazF antagonist)